MAAPPPYDYPTPIAASEMPKKLPYPQSIYESGEYSDLTVRTATRDFKVHKCWVCPKCLFFAAAVRGGWLEAQTSVVEVEESAAVMDVIFHHLYGIPIPFLPLSKDTVEVLYAKGSVENFHLAVKVIEAADKYMLPELKAAADIAIVNCTQTAGVEHVVDFAQTLEDLGEGQGRNLFALAVIRLGNDYNQLLRLGEAWYALNANADLHKLVLEYREYRECANSEQSLVEFFADKTGKPRSDFSSPKTRSGWYLKKWGSWNARRLCGIIV